ncbi:MAG: hypothetical protein ABSC71_06950, partial [Candidatus Acidiferrales bacterium]
DYQYVVEANLALVATTGKPSPMDALALNDATNQELYQRLAETFVMLRLLGTVEYHKAYILTGYVIQDEVVCQTLSPLERFFGTPGCLPWKIRPNHLQRAVDLYRGKAQFLSHFADLPRLRFYRGWVALNTGLQRMYSSDRIHEFVRALEALIVPKIGRTKMNFVERCAKFAAPLAASSLAEEALKQAYEMRCDVEHLHDWDRSLAGLPQSDREHVAFWRTRQMETLACTAYVRILEHPALQQFFHADTVLEQFWLRPDQDIRSAFGVPFDITTLSLVRKYDASWRARLDDWPSGWFENHA